MNRKKHLRLVLTAVLVLLGGLAGCGSSKESSAADPLTGTWKGTWGPSATRQTEVTLDLKWDGTALKGVVNPGSGAIDVAKGSFDAQTNSIKMELDGPNSRREIVRYVIEGKVSGTEMSGTFDRAGEKGTFKIEKN